MIKVAIVEGNKTIRESLEMIVNLTPGCRSVGAWNSTADALKTLHKDEPHVLLLDAQLANHSGVESTLEIKQWLPKTQVLMLTVYEDPDRIFGALAAGASGYLLKRSSPDQIAAGIRDAHRAASANPQTTLTKNSPIGELAKLPGPATLADGILTPETNNRTKNKANKT